MPPVADGGKAVKQSFKERLRRGDTLIGTILSLPCPEIAEILAEVGFDWLFVDAEHAPFDATGVQRILQAAGPHCASIVRGRRTGRS